MRFNRLAHSNEQLEDGIIKTNPPSLYKLQHTEKTLNIER